MFTYNTPNFFLMVGILFVGLTYAGELKSNLNYIVRSETPVECRQVSYIEQQSGW